MSAAIELTFLLLLILVNGLFAMSEIAVISARKTRLRERAEEGDRKAEIALQLADDPNDFLSTVQIGITLVGIFAGAFGGATLAEKLSGVLAQIPALARFSEMLSVGVVVLGTTYLSLVVGELVPKRLGMSNPERLASTMAPLMQGLSRVAAPLVSLLTVSTDVLARMIGVREDGAAPISEEELRLLLQQGTDVGVFDPREQEVVQRALRLDDQSTGMLMTPRPEVVWLDSTDSLEDILRTVASGRHSRYPVARGDLDDVQGFVYAKDLLTQQLSGKLYDLSTILRPALFLPENIAALDAIERLQEARVDVAVVINEYSGFEGILTVDDILKVLVGRIPPAGESNGLFAVERRDGSWLLDGLLSPDEVKSALGLRSLPDEGESHYQTLGGLVMLCLEHLPVTGEAFTWSGWRFKVVKMDGHRVDQVLVVPLGEQASGGGDVEQQHD